MTDTTEKEAALPYDVSRCGTKGCPLSGTCRRKEPGHPTHQVYTAFPGGAGCYGYLAAGEGGGG